MKILVTGAAGFIGFHLAQKLVDHSHSVFGIDSMNDYYPVALKEARLAQLERSGFFEFEALNLANAHAVAAYIRRVQPDCVVHLAAQAGVRYSMENPGAYVESNLAGFVNLMEACAHVDGLRHFLYASSSSVYGANTAIPFRTADPVNYPVSLYAATKKANELIAHAYSHLYDMPVTGMRFFTVYGPWGRPDMAYYKFADSIMNRLPIKVYNNGMMQRDFTYIDDVVEAIIRLIQMPPVSTQAEISGGEFLSNARSRVLNIGNNSPVELLHFIELLERNLGRCAIREYLPMQPGDVHMTYACIDELSSLTGFRPRVAIEEGIERFADWYLRYNNEMVERIA